jgi:putative transposase
MCAVRQALLKPLLQLAKALCRSDASEAKRLCQLEEGNAKLKRIVADLSLDKAMLQDMLSKSSEACAQADPCL